MRAHVWFNLHLKQWSVKAGKERVRHLLAVSLIGVRFHVQESGLRRCLLEKRRQVHAYASGTEADLGQQPRGCVLVSYNPFKAGYFYRKDSGAAVWEAEAVYFTSDGQAWAVNPK